MNALVLYVGLQGINAIKKMQQTISLLTVASTSHMDVFESLSDNLSNEGIFMSVEFSHLPPLFVALPMRYV